LPDVPGRSLQYSIYSACERLGLPPELFAHRLDRGPGGRLTLIDRPRDEQLRMLAYDQIRSAEEDKKAEALASVSLGGLL
jgi:hypothetical protein